MKYDDHIHKLNTSDFQTHILILNSKPHSQTNIIRYSIPYIHKPCSVLCSLFSFCFSFRLLSNRFVYVIFTTHEQCITKQHIMMLIWQFFFIMHSHIQMHLDELDKQKWLKNILKILLLYFVLQLLFVCM